MLLIVFISCIPHTWLCKFYQVKQRRFITSLPIEEIFNRVKANVGQGMNTRCSPESAWSVGIDSDIISKVNHYDQVNHQSEPIERNFCFDKKTFDAPLRADNLEPAIKQMKLREVVGTGDATWWSPQSELLYAPYADIQVRRLARPGNNFRKIQFSWCCKLAHSGILLREKGTLQWWVCMGDLCSSLACVWPTRKDPHTTQMVLLDVRAGTQSSLITILDPDGFEAVPMKVVSPIHQACDLASC